MITIGHCSAQRTMSRTRFRVAEIRAADLKHPRSSTVIVIGISRVRFSSWPRPFVAKKHFGFEDRFSMAKLTFSRCCFFLCCLINSLAIAQQPDEVKSDYVELLRSYFPKRSGVAVDSFWYWEGEKISAIRAENSLDGRRWRTASWSTSQGATVSVSEAIATSGQIVQTTISGSFEDRESQKNFVREPTKKSVALLAEGNCDSHGGVYLLDCSLMFGRIRKQKALVDLHRQDFVQDCRLEKQDSDGNVMLAHVPSGFQFRFNEKKQLVEVRRPEFSFAADGSSSLMHTVVLKPVLEKRHSDGGLHEFEVCFSTDPKNKWVENYRITELPSGAGLEQFAFSNVSDGDPVFPLGTNQLERANLKMRFFHKGNAVLLVDPKAELEIQKVLEGVSDFDDSGRRLKRVPYLRSDSSADCGLYSFAIAAAKQGVAVPIDELVGGDSYATNSGSSVAQLRKACSDFGVNSFSLRMGTFDHLAFNECPAILHCGNSYQAERVSHWAAVLEVDREQRKVLWADLPHEPIWISEAELMTTWDGTAVFISKEPFEKTLSASFALRWQPILPSIFFVAVALVALSITPRFRTPKVGGDQRLSLPVNALLYLAFALILGVSWLGVAKLSFFHHPDAVAMTTGKVDAPEESFEEWMSFPSDHKEFLVVDARIPRDFNRQHVKGALNLPVDCSLVELKRAWEKAKDSEMCVVYCQSEKCQYSDRIAERLRFMGHGNIVIFRPGFAGVQADLLSSLSE